MKTSSILLFLFSIILLVFYHYNSRLPKPSPAQSFLTFSSSEIDILYDESTLSNINEVRTSHFHLSLVLDFDEQTLSGTNELTMISLTDGLQEVHLDIRNMTINQVMDQDFNSLTFQIEANPFGDESIGDRLRIQLRQKPALFSTFKIIVTYRTSPTATALNWLKPEQTSTKTHPYLFSQCESIHCRTVAPLQDTPSIKSTYSANITVSSSVAVFMSANKTNQYNLSENQTTYEFKCSIPIPSYLLAIISGNVVEKQVGPRTFVITEPNDMPAFSKELEDMEVYLKTVEDYITPYQWGYYKIVILPPSFPYGGMENPLLTFASPTIIAGDKSGVFVVIHEIGHSWTGNWVTCENWENFWLNEGFTVFLERKGGFILNGWDHYAIASIVGNISMVDDMKTYGFNDSFSSLHPQLRQRNPDDAFSTVPYEKGFQFLVYLESLVGQELFRKFLQSYVTRFAQQSLVYEKMAEFLMSFLIENEAFDKIKDKEIDWNQWILQPGLPPVDMAVYFKNEALGKADKLAADFIAGQGEITPNNTEIFYDFDMNLKLMFLQYFVDRIDSIDLKIVSLLEQVYHLNNNTNSEVAFLWLRLNVLVDNQESYGLVESFLSRIGRMKFVRPLYVALNLKHHDFAVEIFKKNEGFYHPIAVRLIKQDLSIK